MFRNLVWDVMEGVLEFVEIPMLGLRKGFSIDLVFFQPLLGERLKKTSVRIDEFGILWIDGLEGHMELSELIVRVGRFGASLELLDDASRCLVVLVS